MELSGHLTPQEVTHVHAALQEIVGKTQTKALHLVKALAPAAFPGGNLVAGPIDGLAVLLLKMMMVIDNRNPP